MKSALFPSSLFVRLRALFGWGFEDDKSGGSKMWSGATLRDNLALFLSVAAILLGAATYAALTRTPFFGSDPTTITIFLFLDLSVLLALGTIVAQRIYRIWSKRRRNQAASRLHIRMVSVFTMLAAAPAVLVAMFAAVFFYFGVEAWFSERVSTALDESQEVAQAYLQEHQQVLRADALSMANDLNRQAVRLSEDPVRLAQTVSAQAYLRSLTEVIVFDGNPLRAAAVLGLNRNTLRKKIRAHGLLPESPKVKPIVKRRKRS